MLKDYVFTSESVTEGHPDKMADQISDALLDALLAQDPHSRVACETMLAGDSVFLAGEITTKAKIDPEAIARKTIKNIGYTHRNKGLDSNTCSVKIVFNKQSPDIAQGVNEGEGLFQEQGAGDQGLMFGYAINESENFMPYTIDLAHKLAMRLAKIRKNGTVPLLGPDGKTQVSAQYKDGKIVSLKNIVISTQHDEALTQEALYELLKEHLIDKIVPKEPRQ